LLLGRRIIADLMYENEKQLPRRGKLNYLKGRFKRIKRQKRERHDYKQKAKKINMEKERKFYKISAVLGTWFKITCCSQ
jgi:hypothetical protein